MSSEKNVWPAGKPAVGQKAELTRQVLQSDIEMFTAISGDRNPLHYDEELAKNTKFGGIIVQGGVTSAILNAVVAQKLPGPGTVFLHVDWNFTAPVRPGDMITGVVEVLKVRADKPITELKTVVTLADGTVALEGQALCYTMPVGPAADKQ
jgi:acyl dehydratase